VTVRDRIARLEALLERVARRKSDPRSGSAERLDAGGFSAPPPTAHHGNGIASSKAASVAPPRAGWSSIPPAAPDEDDARSTIPPTGAAEDAHLFESRVAFETQNGIDIDVDFDTATDLQAHRSEPPPPSEPSVHTSMAPSSLSPEVRDSEPMESRSRLVTAPPVAVDRPDDEPEMTLEAEAMADVLELGEAESTELLESTDELMEDGEEQPEPAPSSSRRPIGAEQHLEDLPFDDPAVMRHTPPPESGRLPAAPSVAPLFSEGDTGIREGLKRASEDEREVSSVRTYASPPPELPRRREAADTREVEAVSASIADATMALRPEVIRPPLPSGERMVPPVRVADFAPANFGELLDASLSI
jgi:hypothetical protein